MGKKIMIMSSMCLPLFTDSTTNTDDIVRKHEAHLHNNKGNKRFCEGHKKFCEHETLYRSYGTGNCNSERITLKLYCVEAEL